MSLLIPDQMAQQNSSYRYLKRHYRQNDFEPSKTALQVFYFRTDLHYILPLRKLQQSSFCNIIYLSDLICLERIQQRSESSPAKGLKALPEKYTLQGTGMELQGRKEMGEKYISTKVLLHLWCAWLRYGREHQRSTLISCYPRKAQII